MSEIFFRGDIVKILSVPGDDYVDNIFNVGDKAVLLGQDEGVWAADFTINEKYFGDGEWYLCEGVKFEFVERGNLNIELVEALTAAIEYIDAIPVDVLFDCAMPSFDMACARNVIKKARKAIANFPASLGYKYTHLRKIDAAITKAYGEEQ